MRLKRLEVRGFGRLQGSVPLEVGSARIALVLERNEAGKSTLAAAVLAALFGLESDGRRFRGTFTEKHRFRPWGGGAFGLSLTLECQGRELLIDRDLERETVQVYEAGREITDEFRQGSHVAVGEMLTGLRREQFTLSAFVGQGDIVWADAKGLTEALQRVADSHGGRRTAIAARDALERALTQYDGFTLQGVGRVDTEIKRCETEIASLSATLDELDTERAGLDASFAAMREDEEEDQVGRREREVLRVRRARTETASIESVLEDDDAQRKKLEELDRLLVEDASLLEITDEVARKIDGVRRDYEGRMQVIHRDRTEMVRVRNESERIERERQSLGIPGVPTDDQIASAAALGLRWQEMADARVDLEGQMDLAAQQVRTYGYELDSALSLSRDFDDLREEDRLLLGARNQTLARLDERRDQAEHDASQARRDLESLQRAQGRRKRLGWIFVVVAIVAAAAAFALTGFVPLPDWSLAILPGILGIVGIALLLSVDGHRRREELDARHRLDSSAEARRETEEEEAEHDARWRDLALRLRLDPRSVEQRYRDWIRIEGRMGQLRVLRERLDEIDHGVEDTHRRLADLTPTMGRPVDPDELRELVPRLRQAALLERRRVEVAAEADRLEAVVTDAGIRLLELDTELRGLLGDSGVVLEDDESLELGFDRFVERRRASQGRQELERRRPGIASRVLEEVRRVEQEERLAQLLSELDELLPTLQRELRGLENGSERLKELEQPLGQGEYERCRAALDASREDRRRDAEALRIEVRAFLARYESEAPPRRERLAQLEVALRRAREFQDSILLARDTLDSIRLETHRLWAHALNRHTNELLAGMGSEIRGVTFGDDLSMQFTQHGQVVLGSDAARVLSAGAADALFLAARLAVSRFLTDGGEALPLILDDPFANADDPRLLAAIRLLLETVAPHQQVLLMACQHSRYEWLRHEVGETDRLVFLDVTPEPHAS